MEKSPAEGAVMAATHSLLGIFWDNSNITFTRKNLIPKYEPQEHHSNLRIHFVNMFDFARWQRPVDSFVMVGSLPPDNDPLWKRVMDLENFVHGKFDLIKLNRDIHNKEQGVDDTLLAQLYRFCVSNADRPGTVVLLTGDGAGHAKERGFYDALRQVNEKLKWKVELCAWDCSCHGEMRTWARQNGKYRDLEQAYTELTFIEKGRRVRPLPPHLQSIDPNAKPPTTPYVSPGGMATAGKT
jgi:NYN domain